MALDIGRKGSQGDFGASPRFANLSVAGLPFGGTSTSSDIIDQPVRFDMVVRKTAPLREPTLQQTQIERRGDSLQRTRWALKTDSLNDEIDAELFGLQRQARLSLDFDRARRAPSKLMARPFLARMRGPQPNDAVIIRPAALYTASIGFGSPEAEELEINPRRRNAELRCLAQAIYFEARSEPTLGQVAVANVVLNRVKSQHYPDTICGVVFQNYRRHMSCQFTFACDGRSDQPRQDVHWRRALKIANQVMDGKRQLASMRNATHYHADYVNPRWSHAFRTVKRIGRHIFYRNMKWASEN